MGNEIDSAEQAKAIELGLEENANRRAAATPLPGSAAELLSAGEIRIDDETAVRPVVAADWKIFQAVNSPILQMALEAQKDEALREQVKFQEEDEWMLCWQFTHGIVECLFAAGIADDDDKAEWLETHKELPWIGDAKSLRIKTKKEIGRSWSLTRVRTITAAVIAQFTRSNSTKIGFSDGDESKKN